MEKKEKLVLILVVDLKLNLTFVTAHGLVSVIRFLPLLLNLLLMQRSASVQPHEWFSSLRQTEATSVLTSYFSFQTLVILL